MMPIVSRAGRSPSTCSIADDLATYLGFFVPVLRCGYRTVVTSLAHSSRRLRRPPPVGVACSLASRSATDCPPVSSALRCRRASGRAACGSGGGSGSACGGGPPDSAARVGGGGGGARVEGFRGAGGPPPRGV